MKIYDNIILKDDKFFDGEVCVGTLIDGSFCKFKGACFMYSNLKDLRTEIRSYFLETLKIEIPKNDLNKILGSSLALDWDARESIKNKELVNISVKYGTNSQTLVTEWI